MADLTVVVNDVRPDPGTIVKRKQAFEALAPGDAVYLKSDGKVAKADADVDASSRVMGVVVSVPAGGVVCVAGDYVDVAVFGVVRGFATTPGTILYASTTAAKIADARPGVGSGDYVHVVGYGYEDRAIFINPFTDSFAAA